MKALVLRALLKRDGGPGATVDDLVAELRLPRALVRMALAQLVFTDRRVTCDRKGRYRAGDPTRLIELEAR